MSNGYRKEKKKPFDISLLGQLPYAPGMIEPLQSNTPAVGTLIPNITVNIPWASDVRNLPIAPSGYPPSFVLQWLEHVTEPIKERYKETIFYPDDPADERMGLAFAVGINLIGLGVSRVNPVAGTIILGIPDILVAYPIGVAASNIYQSLEGDTPTDKSFRFWLPKSMRNMPF